MQFQVIKKSKKSKARLGILKTGSGLVETPSLVPVATQAVVKALTSREVLETKTQILISNTFHLHLKPGEKFIKSSGGLHQFMNWQKPIMTDSGGFQVFSLGFGHDLGVGKIMKYFPGKNFSRKEKVNKNSQPKFLKITSRGVWFHSPLEGRKMFLGPEESIKIQERLGADIIFAFDECTPPLSSRRYVQEAVKRTNSWAKACLKAKTSKQAIFGIIQGSKFRDLRRESARFINSLPFDGFGMGGDLGLTKEEMKKILGWVIAELDEEKPRHLLGIGYLEDMENIIKSGIDLFDCTVPTHYARRGIAFVNAGNSGTTEKLDLNRPSFLKEKVPLDKKCSCFVCREYKRNYLSHLVRANEITGMKLLTFHNLYFFNTFVEKIRQKIKEGRI